MKAPSDRLSGNLVSLDTGDLIMFVRPKDSTAQRIGTQTLKFNLKGGSVEHKLEWDQYTGGTTNLKLNGMFFKIICKFIFHF